MIISIVITLLLVFVVIPALVVGISNLHNLRYMPPVIKRGSPNDMPCSGGACGEHRLQPRADRNDALEIIRRLADEQPEQQPEQQRIEWGEVVKEYQKVKK